MKKLLAAFLISSGLVFIYTIGIYVISVFMTGDLLSSLGSLQIPLRLPWIIFDNFVPDGLQLVIMSSPFLWLLLKLIIFVCNVALYAIPFFLLFKFWPKRAE
jgi:hypothetical protein